MSSYNSVPISVHVLLLVNGPIRIESSHADYSCPTNIIDQVAQLTFFIYLILQSVNLLNFYDVRGCRACPFNIQKQKGKHSLIHSLHTIHSVLSCDITMHISACTTVSRAFGIPSR